MARPFLNCGVDYAGPFYVPKEQDSSEMLYCHFHLLAVKAVHVELVSNLMSNAFIAALQKFVAQRRKCLNFYSDSGTTFCGVHHKSPKFREIFASRSTSVKISGICKFRSIYVVCYSTTLTKFWGTLGGWCALYTVSLREIGRIHSIYFQKTKHSPDSSRGMSYFHPLTALFSDSYDLTFLSPGYFPIYAPESTLSDLSVSCLYRWKHLQWIQQIFWKR